MSLAFSLMQSGGSEEWLEVCAIALTNRFGTSANGLEDGSTLGADIGNGLVHALFG